MEDLGARRAPSVSVVIAAHNRADTIAQAIESVIGQTMRDWQLVIVDDASTDGTAAYLDSLSGDSRVKVLTNPQNLGSGASRNRAIAASDSSLVAVLDADDVMLPTRLELQLARFEVDPSLVVLGSQISEFGDWGGPVVSSWPTAIEEVRSRQARGRMPVPHCSVMMRKDAVVAAGGYDEYCLRAQDLALMRKLRNANIEILPDVLTMYRTVRPIPFRYAIASGRYGHLARIRTRQQNPRSTTKVRVLPFSVLTDARSIVTWARRRLVERT